MSRALRGRLEAPTRGRPSYTLRIRVNGKHRRIDLETADPTIASAKRDTVIGGIEAEQVAAPKKSGSVQRIRKIVAQASKDTRTFPGVAERFWTAQKDNGVKTWKEQRSVLQRYVLPHWQRDIASYATQDVRNLVGELSLGYKTRLNVLTAISGVFDAGVLSGLIASNPCKQVRRIKLVPRRRSEEAPKVRATLTDWEVAAMVQWEHPEERHRDGLRRLQTKMVLAHFLGLRHVEIASLRWEDFGDEFNRVTVYRAKKKDPAARRDVLDLGQLTAVRECLRRRWEEQGKPSSGLVLPALSDGEKDRAGEFVPTGVSEANALRRLFRRAMGIEALVPNLQAKAHQPGMLWQQVRDELTDREREVLEGTDRIARVTFHASRNAFAQACDDAGLADEQTQKLLDHESVKVTQGYQRRMGKRAKPVPNVHALLDGLLRSGIESGNTECSQAGHIDDDVPNDKMLNPGFHQGFQLRGQATQRGQRIGRCQSKYGSQRSRGARCSQSSG